jgi:hypothetical protein
MGQRKPLLKTPYFFFYKKKKEQKKRERERATPWRRGYKRLGVIKKNEKKIYIIAKHSSWHSGGQSLHFNSQGLKLRDRVEQKLIKIKEYI